ncbi:MAG: pantoate--beta-alanine ligase [Desulfobacteraceae bacterium]|nr:pantoate--beta-alanine ligase [Desulfobacteraceae bacterium]MBC2718274.1 pantoate--beta-alanine ligase [Desulfobacteraceae bacterium]
MEVITTVKKMQEYSDCMRRHDKTIAFVPTMGYLHEGHLSLIREGRKIGDCLVVSIFVNPVQFAPGEDFEGYPKDFQRDLELARKNGTDVVFAPDDKELYSNGFQTYVNLKELPNHLCGISRPIFFSGVATVVTKLFNIVKPHFAIFGQKDYQQIVIIRQMVCDLNFNIEIIGVETVREHDGLAMSSRNVYLTSGQRNSALCLYKSLQKSQILLSSGINDSEKIIDSASKIIKLGTNTEIDYIVICDPKTLIDMKKIDRLALMALAVKVGKTRLIDNTILRNVDELTSTSRRTDLGQICSISDHKS